MDYRATQALLELAPESAYVQLLVADRELDQAELHPYSSAKAAQWKPKVEELLSHRLHDRTVDWELIYNNIDSLLSDGDGQLEQALVLACKGGHLSEVSILLEAGADPSWDNNSALLAACQEDMPDILEVLLSDSRVDPTVDGNVAYWNANRDGHFDVSAILENDPRVRRLLS